MSKNRRSPHSQIRPIDNAIYQSQEVEGKTYKETSEELGISANCIADAKKLDAYREAVLQTAEERWSVAEKIVDQLDEGFAATKKTKFGEQADGVRRIQALKELNTIAGVYAPKQFDLKHSMAAMSDDELGKAVDASVKELDGRIKNRVAGTSDATANVTNTVVAKELAVAERSGQ